MDLLAKHKKVQQIEEQIEQLYATKNDLNREISRYMYGLSEKKLKNLMAKHFPVAPTEEEYFKLPDYMCSFYASLRYRLQLFNDTKK